jgi:multidrug efflux pump subunit AcrA (membrane-fusion protein)
MSTSQSDRRIISSSCSTTTTVLPMSRSRSSVRLAARERRGRPVEREVADADVVEKRQPLADLLDDALPDQLLGLRQPELVEEPEGALHRHLREVVDRLRSDRHGEYLRLQPRALADRTRAQRHVLLDALAL